MDITQTSIYKEFLLMKEEIHKHKWYESERAGHDIGFVKALMDWTMKYKTSWIKKRKQVQSE
jgi:hypothetical protein